MQKIVGTHLSGYPQTRNISGLPFDNYQVKKVQNFFKIPLFLNYKLYNQNPPVYLNSFQDFGLNKCDLYHFFNAISYGKAPWITTFETALPRWGDVAHSKIRKGGELLASSSCKKLIALSECTKGIQQRYGQAYFPDLEKEIDNKSVVIHPSQVIMYDNSHRESIEKVGLKVLLVGNQIFSKGGRELILASKKIYEKSGNIKLTIVSALEADSYATNTNENDIIAIKKQIEQGSEYIDFLGRVPNQKVLDLLKTSHVAALPTYADTYGYFVLEAQASGCPVISTDIRALPEINNNEVGWVIHVPKNKDGNAILKTTGDREIYRDILVSELSNIFSQLLNKPTQIEMKSKKSLVRIKQYHNPILQARKIEAIYDEALES
jgi:glycosyltransferase involved in cell wall biosynthesis